MVPVGTHGYGGMEEVIEALPPSHDNDLSLIAKGKRTKRHRPHSPIPSSNRPSKECETPTNNSVSPHTSSEESTTTEEEDTAKCLIMMSKGHFSNQQKTHQETTAAFTYACKTCDRVFTSFQALGGHRASHKKPQHEKKSKTFPDGEEFPSPSTMESSKKRISQSSLKLANISAANATAAAAAAGAIQKMLPSPRIHECSYCSAEFTSGQALGGHMRRHRFGPYRQPSNPPSTYIEELEPKERKYTQNGLPLDLNLPAPENQNQWF